MTNLTIREEARKKGVYLWQIANAMNVSEATITRLFRTELSAPKEKEILSLIDKISADRT